MRESPNGMASASQADSRGFDSRLSLHRKRDTLRCPFFCGAREKRTTRDEKIGENSLRTRVSVRARAQPKALPRGPLQGFRQIPVSRFSFFEPHAIHYLGRTNSFPACWFARERDLRSAEGSPSGVSADSRLSLRFLRTTRDEKIGEKSLRSPRVASGSRARPAPCRGIPFKGGGKVSRAPKICRKRPDAIADISSKRAAERRSARPLSLYFSVCAQKHKRRSPQKGAPCLSRNFMLSRPVPRRSCADLHNGSGV